MQCNKHTRAGTTIGLRKEVEARESESDQEFVEQGRKRMKSLDHSADLNNMLGVQFQPGRSVDAPEYNRAESKSRRLRSDNGSTTGGDASTLRSHSLKSVCDTSKELPDQSDDDEEMEHLANSDKHDDLKMY